MISLSSFLSIVHIVGLVLAVGSATVKVLLLLRCGRDRAFLPAYLVVSKVVTPLIIVGMVLLTLSGIGWLLLGYPLTPRLIVKLVLVAAIWVAGPVIDNVVEPRFARLAPGAGEAASAAFLEARRRFVALEIAATALFYVIILLWVPD